MNKIFARSLIALSIVCFLSLSFSMQDKPALTPTDYIPLPKVQIPTAQSLTHLQTQDIPQRLDEHDLAQTQLGDYTSSVKGRSTLAVDIDGDGRQEVIVDFGALGVWLYDPYRSPNWARLSTKDPEFMIAADRNGDGKFEIYADWGSGNGAESWEDGIGWSFFLNAMYDYHHFYSADIDDDGKEEIVIQIQRVSDSHYQLYIVDWVTTSSSSHLIYDGQTYSTVPIAFNTPDDELVTYFPASPRLRWWNYHSSDADWTDNWTSMADVSVDTNDIVAADVDGDTEEEFIADIYSPTASKGTWIYDYSASPQWKRITTYDYADIRPWPRATDTNDEIVCVMNGIAGLWFYAYNDYTKWNRINGLNAASDAGFVEVFNYDSDGDWDIAVDFGLTGLWKYDYYGSPKWTSMNGSDPRYMVKVNIDTDADDELIVVFQSSPAGIWLWDNGTNPKWRRLNGANPD